MHKPEESQTTIVLTDLENEFLMFGDEENDSGLIPFENTASPLMTAAPNSEISGIQQMDRTIDILSHEAYKLDFDIIEVGTFDDNVSNYPSAISYWKSHPVQHTGPITFVNDMGDIGGHRGFVAACDIMPGTLLLCEAPFLTWTESNLNVDDQEKVVLFMRSFLKRENVDLQEKISSLNFLTPFSLNDVSSSLIVDAKEWYSEHIENILHTTPNIEMSADDLILLFLKIQCNGFCSGIYLHLSIFNHSCQPNCIKFQYVDTKGYSEVRATERIPKGEHLTISYLVPLEQIHSVRSLTLPKQFGFLCSCKLCLPGSVPDLQNYDESQHQPILDLAHSVAHIEAQCLSGNFDAQTLIALAIEYFSDAEELLVGSDRTFIARILKLIVVCSFKISHLNRSQERTEHAGIFLQSSFQLLELQRTYLSSFHPDFATTFSDLATGIHLLLTLDPDYLYTCFETYGLTSFRAASKVEQHLKSNFEKIKKMYG